MGISEKFQGASGHGYEYLLTSGDNLSAITHQRGTFVFARSAPGGPVILFAGEAPSLNAAFTQQAALRWEAACTEYAANMLMIRIHPDSSPEERQREVADLVKKHRPPMNTPNMAA
jgi:hypothetical protein